MATPLNLTSNFFFFLTLTFLYIAYTLPKLHPKHTNLVFYVHDRFTDEEATAATVAGQSGPTSSILQFGTVATVDDPVTEGPSMKSKLIGRAQGIYINSQLDGRGLYVVFSVIQRKQLGDSRIRYFQHEGTIIWDCIGYGSFSVCEGVWDYGNRVHGYG